MVDKCGGEIAKLATSSHKKAIETSEEKISCEDACHQDTFQITTTRHASINDCMFNIIFPNSLSQIMTFTKEPPRKDQPLRRDQKSRPQCGHYSEVLLYIIIHLCVCQ